jgi:hypothetical protein
MKWNKLKLRETYSSIADQQDPEHHVLLYKIDDLFVEVYYSKEHNIITKFNPFKDSELLDTYLPKN